MKSLKFLVLTSLLLMLPKAQAKIALLIGNDAYTGNPIPALDKAVSDAKRLKNKLIGLGFTVIFKTDLNTEEMRNAIIEFHDALKKNNEVGLFYYAGHGMQVNGDNFLIPVKSNITREFQAKKNAINADEVLEAMFSANTKINLMILDACRDNPLASRGGKRGLAAISRKGTFIAYATQPNTVAGDGVFMDYLSKRIMEPLPIDEMIKKVRNDVRDKTEGSQVPTYNNNLAFDFYFNKSGSINKEKFETTPTITPKSQNNPSQVIEKIIPKEEVKIIKTQIKKTVFFNILKNQEKSNLLSGELHSLFKKSGFKITGNKKDATYILNVEFIVSSSDKSILEGADLKPRFVDMNISLNKTISNEVVYVKSSSGIYPHKDEYLGHKKAALKAIDKIQDSFAGSLRLLEK